MTSHIPLSDTVEIRVPLQGIAVFPAGLPRIPGGWTEREWVIEGRSFRLILPATPDAFLQWVQDQDRDSRYFVLLVKPTTIETFSTIRKALQDRRFDVGYDLLPSDKTAIDAETGAGVQ